ncbi:Response regulator c-di-GMP phosphodiesterase, RpfG family, contains REC and HD-GYP domains [Formivibrio citricus]|uniref:Response regulator c-di-GMP phosphodiesterase, RpfG family, contains REC and HD-GYP domains n=1 Tax=Formivibrio citricus TaxID=83765 RepID=A0A1I4Y843_9NEIS|nr:HD domain-containing phosphohydrolase [Formivibrio citricus]SFN33670.1 Response regulator c-di-GMP phosphodiesterase, RpfG family, contains REC and HD-GYP domains [Formivibrio citricus]
MTEDACGVQPETPATLLLVDDEASILSSLRRLFRSEGYRILTAESGAKGLEILEQEKVDLIISDMRMPEMDGAAFLGKVKERWPRIVRILLTGYADITSTIAAINQGEIYRYIAKPWDDTDIILNVRQALEQNRLKAENERLQALTEKQNHELRQLNEGLEALVEQRTGELRQTVSFLELAQQNLKKSYLNTVKVFSGLLEMRNKNLSGHSRRVADHARKLAIRAGLNESDVQDVVFAALLHDIGKMALPDRLLEKPFYNLTMEDQAEVMKHSVKGEMALMAIEQLQTPAKLIRAHHERFDGNGYPDRLAGFGIPMGARILAIANEFDALQAGTLQNKKLSEAEARAWLVEGKGKRYDPALVDLFNETKSAIAETREPEIAIKSYQLRPGLVLARDLVSGEGYLLLARGHALTDSLIEQIRQFEKSEGASLTIYVRPPTGAKEKTS